MLLDAVEDGIVWPRTNATAIGFAAVDEFVVVVFIVVVFIVAAVAVALVTCRKHVCIKFYRPRSRKHHGLFI